MIQKLEVKSLHKQKKMDTNFVNLFTYLIDKAQKTYILCHILYDNAKVNCE